VIKAACIINVKMTAKKKVKAKYCDTISIYAISIYAMMA